MRLNYRNLTEPILRRASRNPRLGIVYPVGRRHRAISGAIDGNGQVETRLPLAAHQKRHVAAGDAEDVRKFGLRCARIAEVYGEFVHTLCLHSANTSSRAMFAVGNLPEFRFSSTLQTCA